ncbi:MAG TPA: hypothetical protein VGE07_13600 [Herpetosiphonaceae bacterium]
MKIHLDELLTPELLERHQQHIRDFLAMEGLEPAGALGRTLLEERAAKELLAELAHDLDSGGE